MIPEDAGESPAGAGKARRREDARTMPEGRARMRARSSMEAAGARLDPGGAAASILDHARRQAGGVAQGGRAPRSRRITGKPGKPGGAANACPVLDDLTGGKHGGKRCSARPPPPGSARMPGRAGYARAWDRLGLQAGQACKPIF